VHEGQVLIVPVYKDFKQAYTRSDWKALRFWYDREQKDCRLVDVIDKRDSIDPNVKLFEASALLVSLCNDIEVGWAFWAKAHGEKYDKNLIPPTIADVWKDGAYNIKKMHGLLRHPGALA